MNLALFAHVLEAIMLGPVGTFLELSKYQKHTSLEFARKPALPEEG